MVASKMKPPSPDRVLMLWVYVSLLATMVVACLLSATFILVVDWWGKGVFLAAIDEGFAKDAIALFIAMLLAIAVGVPRKLSKVYEAKGMNTFSYKMYRLFLIGF